MDRRATLATFLGKSAVSNNSPVVLSGLDPYVGPWELEQAAHLLRRTMFGPTYNQMKTAVQEGLDATVEQLLSPQAMPAPPLNSFFQDDPNVNVGETWIDAPYVFDVNLQGYRFQSLGAWTVGVLLDEGVSVREKMTLFWHNHFVTAGIGDPKYVYRYITLLREKALGNFRELVEDITIDPAMLRYLNGNQNTKEAPNENYARELLELFTIGKGELAGPGDYTTFTEDDVIAIAKVLTGWVDIGFLAVNPDISIDTVFVPVRHDTSTKVLSERFDNAVIPNANEEEYKNLIQIIFQQEEVARFISRKLYRWFVYYDINEDVEMNMIEPMAQLLIDNDFEVYPVLEALFKSQHFYDILVMGPMIKNPIDFTISLLKQFEVAFPANLAPQYNAWTTIGQAIAPMQMQYYNPPDVAGWKAYYQEPLFYRLWINSVTLPIRMGATDVMTTIGIPIGGNNIVIDVLTFIETIDDPLDPNAVIEEFARILFPQPITENQKAYLKNILIPGLPDFEWTVEYSDYLSDPGNVNLAASIEAKLRFLLRSMLNMPEYYLS